MTNDTEYVVRSYMYEYLCYKLVKLQHIPKQKFYLVKIKLVQFISCFSSQQLCHLFRQILHYIHREHYYWRSLQMFADMCQTRKLFLCKNEGKMENLMELSRCSGVLQMINSIKYSVKFWRTRRGRNRCTRSNSHSNVWERRWGSRCRTAHNRLPRCLRRHRWHRLRRAVRAVISLRIRHRENKVCREQLTARTAGMYLLPTGFTGAGDGEVPSEHLSNHKVQHSSWVASIK